MSPVVTTHNPIKRFLAALKQDGGHSPTDWHRFYMFLNAKKGGTLDLAEPRLIQDRLPHIGAEPWRDEPARPLILAASGESAASKHERLGEQLYWAHEHGCLDEALRYLKAIPAEEWESCFQSSGMQSTIPEQRRNNTDGFRFAVPVAPELLKVCRRPRRLRPL